MENIKELITSIQYRLIRPIKNFFFWGKAFAESYDDELYGSLEQFVMLKTQKLIDHSKTRKSVYLNGDKYLKKTKILNELATKMWKSDFYGKTPYDSRLEELKEIWWRDSGEKREGNFLNMAYYIRKEREDGGCCYTPVEVGFHATEYRIKILARMKIINSREEQCKRLFHKYLKQFDNLAW